MLWNKIIKFYVLELLKEAIKTKFQDFGAIQMKYCYSHCLVNYNNFINKLSAMFLY